ncbi:MAG: hypothetical protein WD341_14815 [Tistlia sp.]|uniref:hypothetical protein n=1 Tax=Tistlia sp. TaxID=3057121 RepID=UPI0034A2182F
MRSLAVLATSLAIAGLPAEAGEPYRIAADAAECLRARADTYLAEPDRDVFLIVVAGCEDAGVDASSQSIASSGVDGPGIAGGTGEDIIVLTRKQLECLRDAYSAVARPVPVDLVALNFSSCRPDDG